MMKQEKAVILVDSVEEAVKFYTDRLGFDLVDLSPVEGKAALGYAEVRKGKCYLIFRVPRADEIIEFSQVKYAAIRGAGIFVEVKKGLEKYYHRCRSKGVTIVEGLKKTSWGFEVFSLKDPFGFYIMVGQPIEEYTKPRELFCGITLDLSKDNASLLETMIKKLRSFGLSQRAAKKYAKMHIKEIRNS